MSDNAWDGRPPGDEWCAPHCFAHARLSAEVAALRAERDAAVAERDAAVDHANIRQLAEDAEERRAYAAEAERDAALAEAARLRGDVAFARKQLWAVHDLLCRMYATENADYAADCQECAIGRTSEWRQLAEWFASEDPAVIAGGGHGG